MPRPSPPPAPDAAYRSDIVRFGGGFLIAVVGLLIFIGIAMAISEWREHADMRGWPSTKATVTRSVVDDVRGTSSSSSSGRDHFEPRLGFSFRLDGKTIKANFRRYAEPMSRGDAQGIVDAYPLGAEVTIYYDPESPVDVILDNDPPVLSGRTIGFLVAAIGFAIYFAGWLVPALLRGRRARRAAASGSE